MSRDSWSQNYLLGCEKVVFWIEKLKKRDTMGLKAFCSCEKEIQSDQSDSLMAFSAQLDGSNPQKHRCATLYWAVGTENPWILIKQETTLRNLVIER